jgi:hypothetical protein
MLRDVRAFLAACQKLGPQVFTNAIEAELSLGVTVGDSVQYIVSIDFSSTELLEIATLGIALSITAYPTSDEANDPTSPARTLLVMDQPSSGDAYQRSSASMAA